MNRTAIGPLAGDVIAVFAFAAIGRASHTEGLTLPGIAHTAWPFLVGLAVGWVIVVATRLRGEQVWPAGVAVWGSTFVIGLVLRGLSGAGLSGLFPVIAGISLAVVLLAPRAIASFVSGRLNRPTPTP
ncbi:DUF3054 domain-containing protein [Smaragdicoccus niigatensis]|uniref:DUF3054 domain-containing protein n=1 Tax=Smaragdicoccus niigatensis TaxID=359359 RepID=UPI0003627C28|nr:DUF3054 domain-containing protein [Smaragdicoccus niigatensis]